jgi:hypothetical protein
MSTSPVKGIAATDVNVRQGPKKDDKQVDKLIKGQEIIITGFAIDPTSADYPRRLQINHKGETRWVAAKLVLLDPASLRQLPFLSLDLANPAEALVQSVGISPKDVTLTVDEAVALVKALGSVELRGTWTKAQLDEVRAMLEKLETYGVTLGGEDQGKWSLEELKTVAEAIGDTARGIGHLVEARFGIRDDAMAFSILFAPLQILRSPKDNVSPQAPKVVWYAKNSNGYEIVLSNKVFFKGTAATKTNPRLPYTSKELIAHEISHAINWRYPRKRHEGKGLLDKPSVYYPRKVLIKEYVFADGQKASLGALNVGYGMAARSSDGEHETVTDAITCLCLDRFTTNSTDAKAQLQGKARKEQITTLMNEIIRYRIENYGGGVEAVKEEIRDRWGQSLLDRMTPALLCVCVEPNSLDSQLATLKEKLAQET